MAIRIFKRLAGAARRASLPRSRPRQLRPQGCSLVCRADDALLGLHNATSRSASCQPRPSKPKGSKSIAAEQHAVALFPLARENENSPSSRDALRSDDDGKAMRKRDHRRVQSETQLLYLL